MGKKMNCKNGKPKDHCFSLQMESTAMSQLMGGKIRIHSAHLHIRTKRVNQFVFVAVGDCHQEESNSVAVALVAVR